MYRPRNAFIALRSIRRTCRSMIASFWRSSLPRASCSAVFTWNFYKFRGFRQFLRDLERLLVLLQEREYFLHRRVHPNRRERLPVQRRWSELAEHILVLRRAIA